MLRPRRNHKSIQKYTSLQVPPSFSLEFLSKNIEYIGKIAAWGISILIILFAISNAVFDRNIIYVKPTNLPEENITSGFSSINLTEDSIIRVQKIIDSRITNDSTYVNNIIKNYKLSSENCQKDPLVTSTLNELSKAIIVNLSKISTQPEIAIPEAGISLNILSDFLQRTFGKEKIQMDASIIKISTNNEFLVHVSTKYNSNFSHISELKAKNFEQAKVMLSLLMLKYTNPAIYASIMFPIDPEGTEEGILLAIKYLPEYNNSSLPYTLLGYLYLTSNQDAAQIANNIKAKEYIDKAVSKNPKDLVALLAQFRINNTLENERELNSSTPEANEQQYTATLDKLISRGEYVRYAYNLKADFYRYKKNTPKVKETYLTALSTYPFDHELTSGYVNFLSSWQMNVEAKNVLAEFKSHYSKKYDYDVPSDITMSEMLMMLRNKEYESANKLASHLSLCDTVIWANILSSFATINPDKNKAKLLNNYAIIQSAIAERNGADGFFFYSTWAAALNHIQKYDDAILKYKKALEFSGTHEWAYLNIAETLISQGKFSEAESYAKESLNIIYSRKMPEIGTATAARGNYMTAIYYQKDYKRYIEEYYIWQLDLLHPPKDELLLFLGISNCKIGNKIEAEKILKVANNYGMYQKNSTELLSSCIYNKSINARVMY